MKSRIQKIGIIAFIVCLMGVVCLRSTPSPLYATSIKDAKQQKVRLQQRKKEIEQKIKNLEKQKSDVKTYIQKLDQELNTLNNQLVTYQKKIAAQKSNLALTKKKLQEAKETEQQQYITMKKRIKYIYEHGNTDYAEILLSSKNMADLLNRTEYIAKIAEYDSKMLERYRETQKRVEAEQAALEHTLEQLQTLHQEVKVEQASVKQLAESKREQLSQYTTQIGQSQDIADKYAEKIKKQDDLIEQLIEAALRRAEEAARRAEEERRRKQQESGQTEPDTPISSTGFIWPAAASRRITSPFGYRSQPTAGASTYHKGIDIGAPSGSNILAADDGTVSVATYQWAAGNYIMLTHGNNLSTVYMHCSKLLVSVGQTVKKGQVIALVGSTGVSTGPHLHFGVRENGVYKNPLNYVKP